MFGTQYHTTNLNGYNPKQKARDNNSGASDENGKNKHSRATVPNFMMSFAVHHAMVKIVSTSIVPVKVRYVNKRNKVTT